MVGTTQINYIGSESDGQHDERSNFLVLKDKQNYLNNCEEIEYDIGNDEAGVDRFHVCLHRYILSNDWLYVRVHLVRIDIVRFIIFKFEDHSLLIVEFDCHIALVSLVHARQFHNKRLPNCNTKQNQFSNFISRIKILHKYFALLFVGNDNCKCIKLDGWTIIIPESLIMSFMLPHLDNGWEVDQAILTEPEKLVVIRWGHDYNPKCMQMDEIIMKVAYKLSNFVTFYVVDISKVPDFTTMYELYDEMTLMFFYRNKHIMIDTGTGNNNKITWVLREPQDMIDVCEVIYRGARKGKGLVVAPKDYSLRNRY